MVKQRIEFNDRGEPAECPECGYEGEWTYSDGHEPIPGLHGWECPECGAQVSAEEL